MPEIRHQQLRGSRAISSAEIHIPDDSDLGTGSFTTVFNRNSILGADPVSSFMVNPPVFQIAVTVSTSGTVAVLIGDTEPLGEAQFKLPKGVSRRRAHTLRVEFVAWKLVAASFDGTPLEMTDSPDLRAAVEKLRSPSH
ncbi:MAG: hypothetical protein ACXW5U_11770 [Thermoanaerobaculia bacterium]